ncbi:MAG: large conductance mechanosensitive channel protein MscL [Fimbriimonadales bacterium]|nr:large conductance mechanosensitive channel protein MscL [Fimbriimonadales bacterium]
MLKEFREFAIKGNMVDMAVGIILGGAFGGVVQALVNSILMPPIGLLVGGADFANLFVVLREGAEVKGPYPSLDAATKAGATVIAYGTFVTTVINFLIVAFAVFLLVKAINALRREREQDPAPAAPPEPTAEERLLTEIRDLLAGQRG